MPICFQFLTTIALHETGVVRNMKQTLWNMFTWYFITFYFIVNETPINLTHQSAVTEVLLLKLNLIQLPKSMGITTCKIFCIYGCPFYVRSQRFKVLPKLPNSLSNLANQQTQN